MESQIIPACKKRLKRVVYGLEKLCPVSPKNLSEGLHVCSTLHVRGIPSTLGKFSKAGDDPAEIISEYQLASNVLKSCSAEDRFYLSVKPTALNFDRENGFSIATVALQNGHGIHFDSREHAQTDPTIRLLENIMDQYVPANDTNGRWRFGMTLPSRWKRSMADAQWAAKKGVRVRLCKGEFKASGSSDEIDPGKGFLELVDRLAGNVAEIALASHDYALVREAIARCKNSGSSVQLELLFGLPVGRMIALSREMEVPVRFYVPYGDALLIYGIRFFLRNPRRLLRPGFLEMFVGFKSKLDKVILGI